MDLGGGIGRGPAVEHLDVIIVLNDFQVPLSERVVAPSLRYRDRDSLCLLRHNLAQVYKVLLRQVPRIVLYDLPLVEERTLAKPELLLEVHSSHRSLLTVRWVTWIYKFTIVNDVAFFLVRNTHGWGGHFSLAVEFDHAPMVFSTISLLDGFEIDCLRIFRSGLGSQRII